MGRPGRSTPWLRKPSCSLQDGSAEAQSEKPVGKRFSGLKRRCSLQDSLTGGGDPAPVVADGFFLDTRDGVGDTAAYRGRRALGATAGGTPGSPTDTDRPGPVGPGGSVSVVDIDSHDGCKLFVVD